MEKIKKLYNNANSFASGAVMGDVFSAVVCILTYIFWAFGLSQAGVITIAILMCLQLLFSDSVAGLFLPILCIMLTVRDTNVVNYVGMWPLLVAFVPCAVFFLWRNAPKKFRLGKLFFPQVAVSAALLLGGADNISGQNYLRALPLVLVLGIGILALYFLLVNYVDTDADLPLHLSKVCVYVALVVCAQLVTVVAQHLAGGGELMGGSWNTGWGNRNTIATFLPFGFVSCLYLCTRNDKTCFVFFPLAFLQYGCLLLTFSRGGVLAGTVAFIVALVFAIVKGNTKRMLICLGVAAAIVIVACILLHEQVRKVLASLWERFSQIEIKWEDGKLVISGTSSRAEEGGLYDQALDAFKNHPIFGIGIGHVLVDSNVSYTKMDWFHSTVFEILGSMGIVGVLCYGYYYFMRFRILLKGAKGRIFPWFFLAAWIAFEGQSLVDVGLLEPIFIIFVTLQTVITERFTQKYEEKTMPFTLASPVSAGTEAVATAQSA